MTPGVSYLVAVGEVLRVHDVTHDVRFTDGTIVTLPSQSVRPPIEGQLVGMMLFVPDRGALGLPPEE